MTLLSGLKNLIKTDEPNTINTEARIANRVTTLNDLQERCAMYTDTTDEPMTAAKHLKIFSNLRIIEPEVWTEASAEIHAVVMNAHKSAYTAINWLVGQRELASQLPKDKVPLYTRLEVVLEASLSGAPIEHPRKYQVRTHA